MSDLSNKCVLLKGLPFHLTQADVLNILQSGNFRNGVDKLQPHTEKHDDKRWIVLFKTEEDATRCFNHGQWKATVGGETVTAVPDFCSECIIPDAWAMAQPPDRSWVVVDPENYSSDSSGELHAGESMPFEFSESGNNGELMKETFVYKNNLDDDEDSATAKTDASKLSSLNYENLSDSALFGSGYKKNVKLTQDNAMGSSKTSHLTADGSLGPNTQTTLGSANVLAEYDIPKGRRESEKKTVTFSDVKRPQATISSTELRIPTKTVVAEGHKDSNVPFMVKKAVTDVSPVSPYSAKDIISDKNLNRSPANIPGTQTSRTTVADRNSEGINALETGVGNANQATYQEPQNANVGPTEKNEQQTQSYFPYPGQPTYPGQPYGFSFPAYYPGYFGPMPGINPNQQPYIMPCPNAIPPQYTGQGGNIASNVQGLNQQLPFYPPHHMYPYMFPAVGHQMYSHNVPVISGQIETSGDMTQPINTEAVDHDINAQVSRKEDVPKQTKPIITEDDVQDYITPISRQMQRPTKHIEGSMDSPLHADEGSSPTDVNKGPVSETSFERKSTDRVIRIDSRDIPKLPKKRPPPKQAIETIESVEHVEDGVYDEIPADMVLSLDQDVILRHPIQRRKLPPIPSRDRKTLSSEGKQHALETGGDRRSLPADIAPKPLQTTEAVDPQSPKQMLFNDGEKISSNKENYAKRKEEETNKIIVTGFKDTSSLEGLGFFFENKRKSGGDEIVKSDLIKDPDAFIIEFRDSSVVESVLQKQEKENFKLDGAVLKVRPYIPPPVDECKIFLAGVPDGVSRESLEMFVEVVTGLSPIAVDNGETPGTVMLTFDEPPDYDRVKQTLKKRTLEDRIVTVTQVEVSSSVQVTGYASNVTHDMLMFYFENKRSGGGEIVHVKSGKCRSIVQFRYAEDARRVCDGRKHTLNEKELNVKLYYKCMDLDINFEIKIPEPLVIHDINRNILRFVRTPKFKDILDSALKQIYGVPDWSSSAENKLIVSCTLDPKDKESVRLVKTWSCRCTEAVNKVIDTLDVNEDIIVQQEVWSKSLEALGNLDVPNPDDVAVFIREKEMKILVCGEKQAVAEVSEKISGILEETEKKTMEDSREIKKTIMLKMYQVNLLNTLKFFDQSNFSAFKVVVEIKEKREIIFSGQKCNIDKVISTMKEQLKGFARRSFIASKLYKDMMFKKEVRDYIKTKMMKQKVIGVWDVVRGDDNVYMYSKTDKQAQVAIDVVNECLIQKTIPLDLKMEDQIDGDTGKKMISKLLDNHQGLLKLEKTTGQLLVITVDYLMEKVYEEIKQFLDLHMITEEFVDVSSGRLYFINQFFQDRLDQIENQYKSLSVVVEQHETQYRQGFKIKGQKDGCKLAINQLQKLIENVCAEEHCIESQEIDVKQFFEGTPGRNELIDIQMKEKCVLKIKPDKKTSPVVKQQTLMTRAECCVNTCKIIVLEGDLTELHDKVDVIVNPRNLYMSNKEGLSGAIIHKGGYDIEKECESFSKTHELSYGDVFVGIPGKLKCRNIFHVTAPEWRGGSHNEENLLRITVKNCFDKMLEKKLTRIAFSAVGTGRFRFPTNKAIANIVKFLHSYVNGKESPFVKEVFLCDLQHDIVTSFVQELKRVFQDVKEIKTFDAKEQSNERGRRSPDEDRSPELLRRQRGRRSEGDVQDRKIKVVVVKGELARQKVDVIVNSTNTNLDLKVGTLSRSLLKVGGETILQELQRKYSDGIKLGEIAVSTGGNLLCNEIFHGVLVKWDKGQGTAEKVMETFVWRCLELADERGMISIAFPALGTGVLGFPADRVARLLYETVHGYGNKNPDTGISSVLLVVYQEDLATLQAFSFIEEKVKSGRFESKQVGSRHGDLFAKTFSMAPADLNTSHQFNIGPVSVTILQGDITKEKTDIVVNSTIEELNLSSGAVSKAILSAAGSSLQIECHSAANRAQMKTQGHVMTSSGNMMCGKLLHIKARSKASNWEETVMKCLKLVEADGSSSVSFPALGTGGKGCNPDSVAKAMFSAFKNYIQSQEYKSTLKSIRIVIFQADMVKVFVGTSQEGSRSSWKFIERLRHKPKTTKVVFRIFADSAFRIKRVKSLLDDIFVEETLHPRKQVVDALKDRQVNKIKRMGDDKNINVHINPRNGSIKLYGAKFYIKQVKDEINGYLNNIEKDTAAAAAKGAIALPKSWGKMGLTDATQVISLPLTDSDYMAVAKRFQAEALGVFTNIVKIERIQSPTLYTQYIAKKKQMEQSNPSGNVEQILWHGTKSQVVDNINKKGFDRNYNAGASHGVGVYFAVKAATSVQGYCQPDAMGQRHIYLARVLTGDYAVGQGASRLPPPKPTGIPHDRYDSTTDNMAAPNFFVIFHDAQAYPEFLITFQ